MNKKLEEKIIEYSTSFDTPKWVMTGGEILRYVGTEMVLLDFKKVDGKWVHEVKRALVEKINNYDPISNTYDITYTRYDDKGSSTLTEKIIPQGFVFTGDPEETGWTRRFIPYSQHFKRTEEELFYLRLKTLFNSDKGIDPEKLKNLWKNQKDLLEEKLNISAVINSDIEGGIKKGILTFRISEITTITKNGNKDTWNFGLRDRSAYFMSIPKYLETEDGWMCKNFSIDGVVLGDLKLIDLGI